MAFYTSRVDDHGIEIERRPSARSIKPFSNLSSRMSLDSPKGDQLRNVRYVNPAAYIEKSDEQSDCSSVSEDARLNEVKFQTTESHSDIVPPLDLQSEENNSQTTTRDYTFSYRKHCEAAKLVLKPDQAYETWLSAKRKVISDEASRRKKAADQKRKEQEERKRLAEEKYQQWLDAKAQQEPRSQVKNPVKSCTQHKAIAKPVISEQEARANRIEWERNKRAEGERRRMLKRQEEERRCQLEENRRLMATEAWKKWVVEAVKKPKPVPLNRGIFTLRGTVSDIYINPNEWQSIIPTKDGD